MILVRMKLFLPLGILFMMFLASLPSCTHELTNVDTMDTVCFNTQIMPIMVGFCGKCHDGTMEGFSIKDTQSVLDLVTSPGDPRASTLYQVITDIRGENFMPPEGPLTQQNRTLIQLWIAQGGKKTMCDSSNRLIKGKAVTNP
jgi:hypothetical protein